MPNSIMIIEATATLYTAAQTAADEADPASLGVCSQADRSKYPLYNITPTDLAVAETIPRRK